MTFLKAFLTYNNRLYIGAHSWSTNIIALHSNHLVVHLNDSKKIILKEYKKKYKLDEMPRARVTWPLSAATADAPPACPNMFWERTRYIINKRATTAASTTKTNMDVVDEDAAETEQPARVLVYVSFYASWTLRYYAWASRWIQVTGNASSNSNQ